MSDAPKVSLPTRSRWRVELGNGKTLPEPDEAGAAECQQLAEYICGHVAIVRRPEVSGA